MAYVKQITIFNTASDNEKILYFSCNHCINARKCNIKPGYANYCSVETLIEKELGSTIMGSNAMVFLTDFYIPINNGKSWKKFREIKKTLEQNFKLHCLQKVA